MQKMSVQIHWLNSYWPSQVRDNAINSKLFNVFSMITLKCNVINSKIPGDALLIYGYKLLGFEANQNTRKRLILRKIRVPRNCLVLPTVASLY